MTYEKSIAPMPEKEQWQRTDGPEVLPPIVVKRAGRPPVVRKRSKDEENKPSSSNAVAKRLHKCKNCGRLGHQRRTCKEPPSTR